MNTLTDKQKMLAEVCCQNGMVLKDTVSQFLLVADLVREGLARPSFEFGKLLIYSTDRGVSHALEEGLIFKPDPPTEFHWKQYMIFISDDQRLDGFVRPPE